MTKAEQAFSTLKNELTIFDLVELTALISEYLEVESQKLMKEDLV
jgi:hypothetical protein